MESSKAISELAFCQLLPENCEALILRLGAGRFIIVGQDEANRLHPVARQRICDLRPGDEVIYQGSQETVQAIDVYR